MGQPRTDEAGYALVAAVASILVFALIALMVIEGSRGTIVAASAEADRARVRAAAEAGLAIALRDLVNGGAVPIDGRVRRLRFGDATLAIAIQDERGKIPLNALERRQAQRMFAELGLTGQRLDVATDSFLDWIDEDEDTRPNGAERAYYAPMRIRPRDGALRSVAEVALVRGVDKALADRLESVATVHYGVGSFEPAHASLMAIRVIEGEEGGAIDLLNRQRELSGQRSALEIERQGALMRRPLTIDVEARLGQTARARVRQIVILTGSAANPYVLKERY